MKLINTINGDRFNKNSGIFSGMNSNDSVAFGAAVGLQSEKVQKIKTKSSQKKSGPFQKTRDALAETAKRIAAFTVKIIRLIGSYLGLVKKTAKDQTDIEFIPSSTYSVLGDALKTTDIPSSEKLQGAYVKEPLLPPHLLVIQEIPSENYNPLMNLKLNPAYQNTYSLLLGPPAGKQNSQVPLEKSNEELDFDLSSYLKETKSEIQQTNNEIRENEIRENEIKEAEKREEIALAEAEEQIKQEKLETPLSLSSSYQLNGSWILLDDDPTLPLAQEEEHRAKLGLDEKDCNLTNYIYHLKNAASVEFKDETAVGFKNGEMIAMESLSADEKKREKEVFAHLLQETYGPYLKSIVTARYGLEKLETLTFGDVKMMLLGVAANVRVLDLECLFAEIKRADLSIQEDPSSIKMKAVRCGDFLAMARKEAILSLRAADSFGELSKKQVEYLLSAFKMLPTGAEIGIKPTEDVLYDKASLSFESKKSAVFDHDLQMLNLCAQWEHLRIKHHNLAVSEYIGKTLAYRDLKGGMVFPVPDKENQAHYYRVVNSFKYKGLIPALIAPLNKNQDAYDSEGKETIDLIFRGTASGTQWYRNTDFRGIGNKVFYEKSKEILKMVEDYLKESKSQDVVLNLSGHSLGGCDTQRGLVLLLEAIADSKKDSPFRKIKKLVMITHNAPRPEPDSNQRFKKAVAKLTELKEEIKIDIDITHVRYFDNGGYQDTVHMLGEVLLGADEDGGPVQVHGVYQNHVIKDSGFVKRKLVDITIEEDYGIGAEAILQRHTFRAFNEILSGDTKWSFRKIRNAAIEDERKRIEEIFARRFHWSPEEKGMLDWTVANAIWYAPYLGSGVKNILHFLINNVQGAALKTLQIGHQEDLSLLV